MPAVQVTEACALGQGGLLAASRAGTAEELLGTSPACMAGSGKRNLTITPARVTAHTM